MTNTASDRYGDCATQNLVGFPSEFDPTARRMTIGPATCGIDSHRRDRPVYPEHLRDYGRLSLI